MDFSVNSAPVFTFERSFDAFCYGFGDLTVLPEGNVIKKSNEPFVFVIADVFMGLSIET